MVTAALMLQRCQISDNQLLKDKEVRLEEPDCAVLLTEVLLGRVSMDVNPLLLRNLEHRLV